MITTCQHCTKPVALGDAVLRSRNFERVAFHADCYELEQALATPVRQPVPEQRRESVARDRMSA